MFAKTTLVCVLSLFTAHLAQADVEELNPFAPGVEKALKSFDKAYEDATGLPAYPTGRGDEVSETEGCYQTNCPIFVDVDKSTQTARLYLDGRLSEQYLVSTGRPGFETPDFNKRFDGRIYQHYDSTTFPGGDYMGLGNMPYAMFISGGVALHGTPEGNWRHLGHPASHGCIRMHPDGARYINGLLRQIGVKNSWVWVH